MARYFLLFLIAVCFLSESAFSQQLVRVRAGEHEDYSRVVFDWDQPVKAEISRPSADTLRLVFAQRATLDLSDAASVRLRSVRSIEQMSAGGSQTVVQITIDENSRFRQLTSGSKHVLDIYHAPAPVAGAAPPEVKPPPKAVQPQAAPRQEAKAPNEPKEPKDAPLPASRPVPAESPPPAIPEPKADAMKEAAPDQVPPGTPPAEKPKVAPPAATPAEKAPDQEAGKAPKIELVPEAVAPDLPNPPRAAEVEKTESDPPIKASDAGETPAAAPDADKDISRPHVITVSLTSAVGLAAFERDGYLWLVLDSSDVTITPQVAGPQKERIPPFSRIDLTGGTAFRTKIPEGMNVYGEGGGLIWRVVISPNKKNLTAAEPQRRFKPGPGLRNGSLFWMLPSSTKILKVSDPVTGDELQVATVRMSDEFAGQARDYVDLEMLHSPVGLAIRPKTDGVELLIERPGVLATHPKGLALLGPAEVASRKAREDRGRREKAPPGGEETGSRRIFNFDRWQMGGRAQLDENQRVIMAGLSTKDDTGVVEDLITLAKLNMANGWGTEAIGFLDLAAAKIPPLAESPEFRALRGAAYAIAGKFEPAFEDLSIRALDGNEEIRYWRTYTLAGLEDWQQAEETHPSGTDVIESYPPVIRVPLALSLAEVALRAGKAEKGEKLLAIAERDSSAWDRFEKHTWSYLSGEARRQRGQGDEAKTRWGELQESFDELYRAKAGLALTELLLAGKEIVPEQAVDRLERLRYIWRGDELETRINFRLGRVYLEKEEFTKGLTILRDATSLMPDSKLSVEIADEMMETFKELFLGDTYRKLTPLEAVTLYEQFPELTPAGAEGDKLVERLAETMVEADLLDRATGLLRHQIDHRLSGMEAARVAIRLAAIHLLNAEPKEAAATLDEAQAILRDAAPSGSPAQDRQIRLLRARALSQLDRPVDALNILADMDVDEDVNRLRADIAWRSGEWDEAAEALEQMIADAGTNPSRQLTEHQAELVLNRAVALNLADNRVALSQLRERFEPAMRSTSRARIFEVLTRPRQSSVLADRETLMSVVSEVDMFREFLDTYRDSDAVATQ